MNSLERSQEYRTRDHDHPARESHGEVTDRQSESGTNRHERRPVSKVAF